MLNELITWVLNTYLGKYLENFNPAQLSVALLTGEVELENVPIRKDALRSFGIPVQAFSGNIGKIKLQIPVRQFRTAPWCIIIERVYAVFGPKNLDDWDDEKEKLAEYEYKISELDAIEAKWRVEKGYTADSYYSTSYTSWLNYGTSLATNILENLELKIIDVHLRYEDPITVPNTQFAAGLKINSLTVQSCDSNWIPGCKLANDRDISFKLIELNDLSVYFDKLNEQDISSKLLSKDLFIMSNLCSAQHHYVLHPTRARAQFKRERCKQAIRSKSRPRIYCEVLIPAVKMSISDFQYKEIAECVYGLRLISRTRSYKLMRPSCTVTENAVLWWKYAAKCHGFNYQSKDFQWLTIKENLRYIRIYKQLLLNPNENITEEAKEFKLYMEKTKSLQELNILRNVCYTNVLLKDLSLKAHHINQGKSMLFHWFPNWWGWYKTSDSVNQVQDDTYTKIENDILSALEDSMENDTYSKRDAVLGYFTFVLVDGQLLINTNDVSNDITYVNMEMEFQNLKFLVEMKPRFNSYHIGVSLGSVCLKDKLTKNTEFLYIVKPQEWQKKPAINKSFKGIFERETDTENSEPWLQFCYEKGPPDIQSDIRLIIKSRSLDIVYNKQVFEWLVSFFAQPLNELLLKYRFVKRSKTRLKFLNNWKHYLMGSEINDYKKNWTLEMDISAPRIILVDNFVDKNSCVVIVDFGRFQMFKKEYQKKESATTAGSSILKEDDIFEKDSEDDNFMTPCSTPPGSKISIAESPTLCVDTTNVDNVVNIDSGLESAFHNKIYDKYLINLTDLQVLVCRNQDRNFSSFKNSFNFHILEKFSICLKLERRVIYTIDPDYPSLTLYGTLPKIVAHISEEKLDDFFRILYPLICETGAEKTKDQISCAEPEDERDGFDFQQNFINTNLMVVQFVIGQMTLEVQSSEKSIAELQVIGARAGITKRSNDTHISMSVHGLLLVDAIQSFGPDFELLLASHRHVGMDTISGSLRQSEPCSPTCPGSPDPSTRDRPVSPHLINAAMDDSEEGKHCLDLDFDEAHALITVDLNFVNLAENNDFIQMANITFNNLDIIANQETIVELFGFVKRLLNSHKTKFKSTFNRSAHNFSKTSSAKKSIVENVRTEICFDFNRLNILVLRSIKNSDSFTGRKVGTLTMSEAKIHATIGKDVSVMGSLGGVQIIDITPEGINHQRIFSVGKDPLTDNSEFTGGGVFCALSNELYSSNTEDVQLDQINALSFQIYRNKDSFIHVKVRMASVWYIHRPRFIQEINLCVSQFKHFLKNFAMSIRNKATDMAKEMVQQMQNRIEPKAKGNIVSQLSMDVVLNTPVLVLPRSDESLDVLVANLGKITAYNAHEQNESLISTRHDYENSNIWANKTYFIDIRNINLFSLNTSRRKELRLLPLPKLDEFYSCHSDAVPVLHDTAILIKIEKLSEQTKNNIQWTLKNTLNVEGSVTECLQLSLSRKQYEQVIASLANATQLNFDVYSKGNNIVKSDTLVTIKDCADPIYAFEEIFETNLVFKIPVFQIHLKNEHNGSLIDITFREFSAKYNRRKSDVEVEVLLRSILIEDLKCAAESNLRNMVDSSPDCEQDIDRRNNNFSSCPNLSRLHFEHSKQSTSMPCKLNSPMDSMHNDRRNISTAPKVSDDNLVIYKSRIRKSSITEAGDCDETKSSINFNCLNLTVSVDRWFAVFDFFGLISNCDTNNLSSSNSKITNDNISSISELKVSVRSLNVILVRNEVELSKVNISYAFFKIMKTNIIESVEGRLKSISLYDLTHFGNLYREKFSTSGPEALSFSYKRISLDEKLEDSRLKENAKLRIQMSSVRYIHTKRFLTEITLFIKELLQLQSPVIRRIKMKEVQRNFNERASQIGLEINAASPIILLPLCYHSNYVLVADLGKFTLNNYFHYANGNPKSLNEILDVMHIDLVNINLFAGERVLRTCKSYECSINECFNIGNFTIKKIGYNLFKETCHLKLRVERNTNSNISHNYPDLSVKGTLSKLNGIVNVQQYKLIRGLFTYNLGEIIDDIYYNYSFNLCESIEKLNTLCTKLESQEVKDSTVWNTMSINLQLENVSILLAEEQSLGSEDQPLACVNFIKSFLEIDTYSDGSQDIDLVSSEILVVDSRQNTAPHLSNNIFKHILKPTRRSSLKDLVQAEIHSRKRSGSAKYTILLNNMRVMAILDYLESIKNFLEEEPNLFSSITPAWRNKVFKHTSQTFQAEKVDSVEVVLNITDSELVFVENVEVIDTNAIILKNTTVLKYKQCNNLAPISIDINHLEIFSCILGAEDESALSIIDPFTLNMELKDNCFYVINHKQLSIRLSYNDVKLFTKMFQSIPNQTKTSQKFYKYGNTDFEVIAPLIAMGFKQRDCWDAMEVNNYNLNDSALWLSQRKQVKQKNPSLEVHDIYLNANFISICVIDDCMDADVPLLELSLSNLKFSQKLSIKNMHREEATPLYVEGNLETIIASDYYNRRLSGWEPIMEPWECFANWQYCAADTTKKSIISFNVTSKQLLKINITTTLIELCEIVHNNWMRDYYGMDPNHYKSHSTQNAVSNLRRRSPFVPFVLKNLTGEPLLFKTLYSLPGGITRTEINQEDMMSNWFAAQQNEIISFDFGPQTKLRHMNSHKLNLHQILVQIQGWTLVGPISIDKVGTYFRYSTLDLQYKKRNRIVFDISLFGSAQKMITIRSALTIINKLDKRLLLKMEVKHEEKVAISVMDPKEHLSVPLRLVDSLIYFKPCSSLKDVEKIIRKNTTTYIDKNTFLRVTKTESADLCFSTCGISWMNCSKDSLEELFTCFGENNAVFHTLVQIKRNKYPHRDNNLPGHTIMLLPPLKIKNLLCCDLLFKMSGNNQGRINPSDTLNIHTINACESFNLSITLDNYKLSGQLKIPMGHTGVVEPKLKLIDVLNRELYLRVSIQSFQGKGMEIFISAPVWIINKSGLPLVYRQEGMNQLGSGQFEEHEKARVVSPLLFSFTDQGSPSLEIRLGNSYGNCNSWCKSFNLHKDIFYRQLKAERSKGSYAIGIHVKRGRGVYSCTTFVILSPRFQLYNRTTRMLEFAQKCDVNKPITTSTEQIITAPAGCNFPFHWPNYEHEPLLCVRIKDIDFCHWSHGIPMNEVHSLYLNVRNDLGDMYFIRLEVISKRATHYFLFTEANTLPPPIRIDNYSEIAIYFHQHGCKPHWRSCVRPQSSLAYALDDPMGAHVLKIEAPGGNVVDFSLNKVAVSQSITYANFIYIAFKETFLSESEMSVVGIEGQQLVLGVKEKKVVLTKKCTGDRSQLWLMNSNGQLEHEGSSPPVELEQCYENIGMRMVLDLETAPNPNEYTNLVVRPPNKQRITTQTWRFENGRLMCHANMCVQVRNGVFGLRPGTEVVLGRIQSKSWKLGTKKIPSEQCIEIQKLRPGSGHLEIISKMDGPIRTIQIRDVKVCTEEIVLIPDPAWNHASVSNRTQIDECISKELYLKFDLQKGLGVSVITRQPCEELAFITLENIAVDIHSTPFVKSYDIKICDLQIDNQLLDTPCPVLLHTIKRRNDEYPQNALELQAKMLPSPNKNAVIFEFIKFNMKPCIVVLEERLILKAAYFFGCGKRFQQNSSFETDYVTIDADENVISTDSKRYYFETLSIGSSQVRLSMFTASKLTPELLETKKIMSLTLIKFEDALIEFDKFCDKHHFEPLEVYLRAIKLHYINQIKWHAASILGSVDFLGNPLGFANDLSEGVSGLIFEGSVKSLVKNVTHGISNSTAKLTETLSDGLGRVVLDEHDNETRQKMLEIQSNTSGNHLAAGLKGLGFGLLGGVTSIVRHTYIGAQSDGIPGFLSGLGRGIVGTVTKPIIGVLDLAAETASAVRETSKSSGRKLPDRKRLPRCVTGPPGGLLPLYSYRQSKGQQYLYIINRRNFSEKLISYEPNLCNDKDAKLRLLITNEYIRIFSRCEEDPAIMFECHLSEVLSCHPLITNAGNADTGSKNTPNFYIEISTNLPKITRPRVKCQNEENAERAARCINYAKSVFDEREQSVTDE